MQEITRVGDYKDVDTTIVDGSFLSPSLALTLQKQSHIGCNQSVDNKRSPHICNPVNFLLGPIENFSGVGRLFRLLYIPEWNAE